MIAIKTELDITSALKQLDKVSDTIRKKLLTTAIRTACKKSYDEMRSIVRVRKGYLKKSLGIVIKVDESTASVFGMIGPVKKVKDGSGKKRTQAHVARFLEYGTINMRAYPFIKPVFDKNEHKIPQIFAQTIADYTVKH